MTRWPPKNVVKVNDFSRFTVSPAVIRFSPLLSIVSYITSAVKVFPLNSVTVRQTPFTAILSPISAFSVTLSPFIVIPKPVTFLEIFTTLPISSTKPVNIFSPNPVPFHYIF